MVEIKGPANPMRLEFDETSGRPRSIENPFHVDASTLEDALKAYCRELGASIRPYDGSHESAPLRRGERKYFLYSDARNPEECVLDIHVILSTGEEVCARQDLKLALTPGSLIRLGLPAC